jgi:hypothetical protein
MPAFLALVLLAAATPAAPASDVGAWRIEECVGTEVVRVGGLLLETRPYKITLQVNLQLKAYCYDQCDQTQTYPIFDAASDPIKLAARDVPGQVRHITLDRAGGSITDTQIMDMRTVGEVTRLATGTCKPIRLLTR